MKLYNTLTNKLEEFTPLEPGIVKMYSCGPTVYSRAHLGNFSAYLFSDLLTRWLSFRHLFAPDLTPLTVKKISNITDVGHLVSDSDSGEDKLEKAAKEQQKPVLDIARHWEDLYHQDEKRLNILPALAYPRATDYIPQIIIFIEKLEKKGLTYQTPDGIYFSIKKFPNYGKLSGNTLENLSTGASGRLSLAHQSTKRNPADFALWKKSVGENANHTLKWDSPWGTGFPGWHIECSAMILTTLGEQIDIHTGGEDNIFPHHECEIAQTEALTGKPFSQFWLHKRFIQLNAEKMSKSTGNVLNLDDVIEKGFSPLDLRYLFLSVHYRQQLNFTWENLEAARTARKKIQTRWNELAEITPNQTLTPHHTQFFQTLEDDLNTSAALATVFSALRELDPPNLKHFLTDFNQIFAVLTQPQTITLPPDIQTLATKRAEARQSKNWELSDTLRDQIQTHGYEIEDTPQGQKITKK